MKSSEIRQAFIDYFKKHEHTHISSSSLIPEDDPTLLFTNAGMNQFKNTFTGLETKAYKTAATSQKCVRAGGKHNDLDNVGHTARHHTFFEMLGNFSFGDYFKKEAIHYAWDFLTNTLNIPKDKLYVTVFETDDEAADLWHTQEGLSKNRIFRFGEADNFWRMGDSGPCGPCSEIFYDHGPDFGEYPSVKEGIASGDDRYVEIWNLVFMQYLENENGKRSPLPTPSIDTGAGLERLAAIMQNTPNNYDTDIFLAIIKEIENISKKKYINDSKILSKNKDIRKNTAAMRVLADHARSCAFLIADGVMPANEGRGYILRRILRRGIRYGKTLTEKSILPSLTPIVVELMGNAYPELKERRDLIRQTIRDEETRFLETLDKGTLILNEALKLLDNKEQKTLDGITAFKLYDTYGFPLDLTKIMAAEKGCSVDDESFEKSMEEARFTAKASWKGKGLSQNEAHLIELTQSAKETLRKSKNSDTTETFSGYGDNLKLEKEPVLFISDGDKIVSELGRDQEGILVFATTPFYGESGGQAGDIGTIITIDASCKMQVLDCTKRLGIVCHHVKMLNGTLRNKDRCHLKVDPEHRYNSMANHSATHLLHGALREVLGSHITQSGSLVTAEKLRFDFTHNKPLTSGQINKIEELVQEGVFQHTSVHTEEMSPQEAIDSGALALFGEKYGSSVRVVKMGRFSTELCGGTHVPDTSWIYDFIITSETGISSGVRRIEAITGKKAFDYNLENRRQIELAKKDINMNYIPTIAEVAREKEIKLIEEQKLQIEKNRDSTTSKTLATSTTSDIDLYLINKKLREKDEIIRCLEKNIKSLKKAQIDIEPILSEARSFQSGEQKGLLVIADLKLDDREVLTDISDKLKNKVGTGIVIIIGQGESSHPLIVSVSKDLTKAYHAGNLLKEISSTMGGKGGGRPDFAQGAAPNRDKIKEAFDKASSMILQ